jgi:hypothetical protein
MSDLAQRLRDEGPDVVRAELERLAAEVQAGGHPEPWRLERDLRDAARFAVPLPVALTEYIVNRMKGSVSLPVGRPAKSLDMRISACLVNMALRDQVDRRHARYRRLRTRRPIDRPQWPRRLRVQLRWRRSGDAYKIVEPRNLAICVTADRWSLSPSYVRDRIKPMRRRFGGDENPP